MKLVALSAVCCGLLLAVVCAEEKSNLDKAKEGAAKAAKDVGNWAAGAWDDVSDAAGTTGTWFKENVNKVEDLFASDKADLEKKVGDTKELLKVVKDKVKDLPGDMSGKIEGWITDLTAFEKKVKAASKDDVEKLKEEWKEKVKPMYEGGIAKVMGKDNGASSVVAVSSLTALLAVVACLLFQ